MVTTRALVGSDSEMLVLGSGMNRRERADQARVSPSALRVIKVYRPSCGARASAVSRRRPVKAAMPHWSASGLWAVPGLMGRVKLPTPRWTIRTGAAGGVSAASGTGEEPRWPWSQFERPSWVGDD